MWSCFKLLSCSAPGEALLCVAHNCAAQPHNKAAEQEDKCRICCNEWFTVSKPFSGSCISSLCHVPARLEAVVTASGAKILSFRMILVHENLAFSNIMILATSKQEKQSCVLPSEECRTVHVGIWSF
jgi:hypothetical protein